VANSYVQPEVSRYVNNLARSLADEGINAPLSILRSDGGLVQAEKAAEDPVSLLLSGPAGGVTGAAWFAEQAGYTDFLTFDMGGTSTDVALVLGGEPRIGRETKVGDLAVRATSVDVRTVGAGGGSIAHVPELTRALRVGPQSAGADPGPAAYGNGGTEPTVTDANVVLGYLPSELAGGEVELDTAASRAAVASIADAMGLDGPEAAAAGIVDIVNENMFGALRLVSVQQVRPEGFRTRLIRRCRAAARQCARPAHRIVAGDRAAVAGRTLRLRRCHHLRPGRERTNPHPRILRDLR
jgi:N-methylhydantoinase A